MPGHLTRTAACARYTDRHITLYFLRLEGLQAQTRWEIPANLYRGPESVPGSLQMRKTGQWENEL